MLTAEKARELSFANSEIFSKINIIINNAIRKGDFSTSVDITNDDIKAVAIIFEHLRKNNFYVEYNLLEKENSDCKSKKFLIIDWS